LVIEFVDNWPFAIPNGAESYAFYNVITNFNDKNHQLEIRNGHIFNSSFMSGNSYAVIACKNYPIFDTSYAASIRYMLQTANIWVDTTDPSSVSINQTRSTYNLQSLGPGVSNSAGQYAFR